MRTSLVIGALFLALVAACSSTSVRPDDLPTHAEAPSGKPPALAFFAHPLIDGLTLSPDGEHIAGVASRADRELLLARKTMGGDLMTLAQVVRDKETRAMTISYLGWAADDRIAMVVDDPLPWSGTNARRDRLLAVDLDGNVRYLARKWSSSSQIYSQGDVVSLLPNDPRHVLVSVVLPNELYPTVVQVNVDTGNYRIVQRRKWGVTDWYADHRGQIRAASGFGKPRGTVREDRLFRVFMARASKDEPFRDVVRWNPLSESGFAFAGFTPDPKRLFVLGWTKDRDRQSIRGFDLAKNTFDGFWIQHPKVSVTDIVVSELDGRPLYASLVFERPEIVYLDEKLEAKQATVDAKLPNRINRFVDFSRDESRALVVSYSDEVPPEYYVLDGGQLGLLLQTYPDLVNVPMSPMTPIEYRSRDGLTIHGYWTRPVDAPPGPVRTIVLPHGGPWTRDVWGWDPVVQFLANRGFAVFQPNFRGSTGYGAKFLAAGLGEWGLAMQDDITDGVRWLITQGMADPERIGIFGMSYGGYAALQGLASTPELYKAGASLAGVSDIRLWMAGVGKTVMYDDIMKRLVGDRRSDKEKLKAASPAKNADEIRVPVLLGHGTRDWNVSVEHSKGMERALKKAGVPVELYIYEDELHSFLDDRNIAHFFTQLARFFEQHLGP